MSEATAKSDSYWDRFIKAMPDYGAPLYLRLALGVRDDAELRALAALVRPGQPEANMLFGVAHYLLLKGAQHPLRAFYPNLAAELAKGDPFPAFRDFCLIHRDEIARLISTRITNTNEVGRSAFLHAGFSELAKEAPEPLNLIEIGPSAGLNLYWDRYGYRYSRDGQAFMAGVPDARLIIETPLKGTSLPPLGPPSQVRRRIGLERSPVDLANEDERVWLKALVWPDHAIRFRRLEQALELNKDWLHDIRAGDALTLLPDVMAEVPRE